MGEIYDKFVQFMQRNWAVWKGLRKKYCLPCDEKRVPVEPFDGSGTVLLSEVANFHLLAGIGPVELTQLLSSHVETLLQIIREHQGIVVQHSGGTALVYWHPRGPNRSDTELAVCAATKILVKCMSVPDVHIAIGTGLILGDFFGQKKQFQIRGPAVVLTENLMSFNRNRERSAILTQATISLLDENNKQFFLIGKLESGVEVYEIKV
jgi:class 3 adenylate cyclase